MNVTFIKSESTFFVMAFNFLLIYLIETISYSPGHLNLQLVGFQMCTTVPIFMGWWDSNSELEASTLLIKLHTLPPFLIIFVYVFIFLRCM